MRWPAAAAVLIGAVSIAGCGVSSAADNHLPGRRLTIYASLPFDGLSAVSGRAELGGIDLALSDVRHRVGRYRIALRVLNDATVQSRGWDPGQTSANARAAAGDPTAIGYIGELDSGASAIAIPLLNRAGIPQISPSSTAVGLTVAGDGSSPGEPQKYYPSQRRTFARVVPNDAVQAVAQARLQLQEGCRRVVVLDDGGVDGRDGAMSFAAAARTVGLHVVDTDQFDPRATGYASLARSVTQLDPDCVLISALPQNHAALVIAQVAAALPEARLFGWSGVAETSFTDPSAGGVPLSVDSRLLLTVPTLGTKGYPEAGRRFVAAFTARWGAPQPGAMYGYEAMRLMLDAISRATHRGRLAVTRARVLAEIFATHDRSSPLGIYSIDRAGDTSLDQYGVYRVAGGRLAFWKAMTG